MAESEAPNSKNDSFISLQYPAKLNQSENMSSSLFMKRSMNHISIQAEKRNSLRYKVDIMKKTNKMLTQRENQLSNQIEDLNNQAAETFQLLDAKKSQLISENDDLLAEYENLPSIEFLQDQLSVLTNIINDDNATESLSERDLKDIGILEENESIDILEGRLNDMIHDRDRLFDTGQPQPLIDQSSKEERELRRKIKLLKIASKNAFEMTLNEINNITTDIQILKSKLDKYFKNTIKYRNKSKDINIDEEINKVLMEAGGDRNLLKKIDDQHYEYQDFKFKVYYKYGKLYGECDNSKQPLNDFLKVVMILSQPSN